MRAVRVDDSLREYLLSIVAATRESRRLRLGVSPRGANQLQRAAQAHAFLDGRDYAVPDDIKQLCGPVLAHRILLQGGEPAQNLLQQILARTEVPL